MFISIGLVVLVSAFVARSISRPIRQLTNIAQAIAGGDVNRKIFLKRKDEFGTLADSLNQMASRLRRENLKLLELNKRQRQFYADITHEIRNPLHTLMGALEMLEMPDLPEEQREQYLRLVRRQAERMNRLFRDLMTLQRYDADEQFVQPQSFDISKLTQSLYDAYAATAERQGIALSISTEPARVYADPNKIEQVLDNLLSNALKYTNQGEVRLSYHKKARYLRIWVEDTGIGIAPQHWERLFDRFYRTDQARSRTEGGTGLGLAVAKSILDAHGSNIHVESQQQEGTTFYFDLPLAQ
jgi:signal transduction histidine kinase